MGNTYNNNHSRSNRPNRSRRPGNRSILILHNRRNTLTNHNNALTQNNQRQQTHALHQMRALETNHLVLARDQDVEPGLKPSDDVPADVHLTVWSIFREPEEREAVDGAGADVDERDEAHGCFGAFVGAHVEEDDEVLEGEDDAGDGEDDGEGLKGWGVLFDGVVFGSDDYDHISTCTNDITLGSQD